MSEPVDEDRELLVDEYRAQLVAQQQKSQDAYDKTVVSLSGGALGVSFAFVTNFVDRTMLTPALLFGAWVAWAFSVTAALASHYFSVEAISHAIKDVGDRRLPTMRYDRLTGFLNGAAGVLFLVGVLLIIGFVGRNIMAGSYETKVLSGQDLDQRGQRVIPPSRQVQEQLQGQGQQGQTQQGSTQQGQGQQGEGSKGE